MLIDNSKKIVLKLGSSTVVDKKGKFKKKMGDIINQRYKKIYKRKKCCNSITRYNFWVFANLQAANSK